MKQMNLEERLNNAADWEPDVPMPLGLERRTLDRLDPRPTKRFAPLGSVVATMAAGAACSLFLLRPDAPRVAVPTVAPTPIMTVVEPPKTDTVIVPRSTKTPVANVEKVALERAPKPRRLRARRMRRPEPRPLLISTDDSVVVEDRVAVDPPVYAPAYFISPSETGGEETVVPMEVSLPDSDVIYTEKEPS